VLNKHCTECRYAAQCREIATKADDLSLLTKISDKDRKKYHEKGIFTVTQLSYTFRPRRRPSLTFALPGHFRRSSRRILFAFNSRTAETR
jgi:predicted RecB family nuclease